MKYLAPEIEDFLISLTPKSTTLFNKESTDDIFHLEEILGYELPVFYHWFLVRIDETLLNQIFPYHNFNTQAIINYHKQEKAKSAYNHVCIGFHVIDRTNKIDLEPGVFYNLDKQTTDDAVVNENFDLYDFNYPTLQDMLVFNTILRLKIYRMDVQCSGSIISNDDNTIIYLDSIMYSLGFIINTHTQNSDFNRIYERYDAVILCSKKNREYENNRMFELGCNDTQTVEKIKQAINNHQFLKMSWYQNTSSLNY